ncbi:HET-domain-containing protein [Trematosphaeria pertusa]|uniref:HET-domain-containing protein n=1 Tax=Trematosphaeria pertusa TaxID=390896 RepID=A0A6A6HU71_9PLEO|nr:HET-domain-containing protein [Trematosphaeria pertusa]KAF2240970.1 HET-domain-containing protein [Trematosphaeria pertusa]
MTFVVENLDPLFDFSSRTSKCLCQHAESPLETALPLEATWCSNQSGIAGARVSKAEVIKKILRVLRIPRNIWTVGMVELGSGTEIIQPVPSCDQHQKLVASALRVDANQPDKEICTIAKCIEKLEIHKNPLNMAAIITTTMLPGCPLPRPPLYGMYPVKEPGDPNDLIGGRILSLQWIDLDLPKLWKSTCDSLHADLCKGFPHEVLSRIRPTWLVDVKRKCVISAPENCSYVALSYVWGNQPTLKATVGNMSQLQRVGALLNMPIAKTIQDAVGVVELLEERYLWVDTLCIVQDNESQKHAEMAKMAAIYANSAVTILAVQGKHANSGLRGFRGISEARNLHQSLHCLEKELRVIQFPIEPSQLELGSHEPVWGTRGWTYQEHLFSRKRLIFDGDSVRWECAAAIWREHVELSLDLKPHHNDIIRCQSLFKASVPDLMWLQVILQNYNKRSFTYPEDALYAFDGIAFSTSQAFAGGFVSGLPIAFFEMALLWQPRDKIFRRVSRDPEKQHCLPSWSWAGWSGAVNFDDKSATDFIRNSKSMVKRTHETRVTRILSWSYHATADAPGKPIHPSILANKDLWLEKQIECASLGWTKHSITESLEAFYESPDPRSPSTCFYKHEAYPGDEFWYPIPLVQQVNSTPSILTPYISCTTRRAWLFPGEELPKKNGYRPILSLRIERNIWAGILQPHDSLDASSGTLQEPTGAVELVEIARGFCRDTTSPWPGIEEIRHPERPKAGQWYEYYWVMWVGWDNGIAYRRGLGRVQRQLWEEQRGELFYLLLG